MKASNRTMALAIACLGGLTSGAAQAGFLEDLACPLFGCADGPPPRLALSCRTLGLTGLPAGSATSVIFRPQ